MIWCFVALVRGLSSLVASVIATPGKSNVVTPTMEGQTCYDVVSSKDLINNSGSDGVQALIRFIVVREVSIDVHASHSEF